jgi:hypothetical protein
MGSIFSTLNNNFEEVGKSQKTGPKPVLNRFCSFSSSRKCPEELEQRRLASCHGTNVIKYYGRNLHVFAIS